MSDLIRNAEKILLDTYESKGFLTEDDVTDVCIDNDLDLVQIDAICERLLNKKLIIRDETRRKQDNDFIVDRSQTDYDALYRTIINEYPNCKTLVDEIKNIMPPQTREWNQLIGQAQNGNVFAKNRLVTMYLRTVLKHAYDFSKNYYCDFEEAFQYGAIGLIIAIDKYDVTSPDTFVSYFPLWVRQNMQRCCEIRGTSFRYPAHYKDMLFRLVTEVVGYMENDDVEAAIELMRDEWLKSSVEDYEEIINDILPYKELTEEIEDVEDFVITVEHRELIVIVSEILSNLKERERSIIKRRFGLGKYDEMTLEEVGNEYGLTRERIRQIESKALRGLRHPNRSKRIESFY